MPKARPYYPPTLQYRIALRNPSEQPDVAKDPYGRDLPPGDQSAQWRTWAEGVSVWAGRRDRTPEQLLEEAAVVYAMTTVWTIREGPALDPDVEVVHGDSVFRSLGPAVERGGPDFGRRGRYLEIHTRLRE